MSETFPRGGLENKAGGKFSKCRKKPLLAVWLTYEGENFQRENGPSERE